MPPLGKKYKGVYPTNNGRYLTAVNIRNRQIRLLSDDIKTGAGKYNAIYNYIGLTSYKNDVEEIELTRKEKAKIDEKIKGLNLGELWSI